MNHSNDPNFANDAVLSADDQRLLDALVDAGFDRNILSLVSGSDSKRLDAICGVMELLNDYPVEDADETLVHATLARIDRYEEAPDFITVAAVLLIGVGVLWPIISSVRQEALRAACGNNMRGLAYAFSQYAADNKSAIPMAMAGPLHGWDRASNVLNLEPLVSGNYCTAGHLNCPGHHHSSSSMAGVGPSYSYRLVPAGSRIGWGTTRVTVILGDLNPIVDAAYSGRHLPPLSVSLNHNGRGQNVLVTDGSSMWLDQPMVGRDNIWLPHHTDRLRGGEGPADESDIFMAH
jgi:hypothetical protein